MRNGDGFCFNRLVVAGLLVIAAVALICAAVLDFNEKSADQYVLIGGGIATGLIGVLRQPEKPGDGSA